MTYYFKFSLIWLSFFIIIAVLSFSVSCRAQGLTDSLVFEQEEYWQNIEKQKEEGMVVLELFSSQACPFCPLADRFLADVMNRTDVITLSCHIDHFDVRVGSLSKPVCNERQELYANKLAGGLQYTPQMVINGARDIKGFAFKKISEAIIEASKDHVQHINIQRTDTERGFSFYLPEIKIPAREGRASVWVVLYDKPHELTIAEGVNKDRKMVYVHVVDDMQRITSWDGAAKKVSLNLNFKESHEGMVILVEDDAHKIIAAGEYRFRSSLN